jgi:hypothetical protein
MEGGGVGSGVPHGGGRRRERGGWHGVSSRTVGPEWLRVARPEAAAHAHSGGGLANRGGRRGVSVSGRVWEGEG